MASDDRIAQLDQNQLVTQVDGIKKDLEQIKALQRVGGDVVNPIILSTSAQYDMTAFTTVGVWEVAFDIIFTADHQTDPYIYPVPRFYKLDGSPLPIASLTGYDLDIYTFFGKLNGNWGDSTAAYAVLATWTAQFYCKVYIQASDTGTMQFRSVA